MKCGRTAYESGIVAIYGSAISVTDFAVDLAREARAANASLASIFFSQDDFDGRALAAAIGAHAPQLRYAACSTAGEISPAGYAEGQIIAILFPSDRFDATAALIENLSTCAMDSIAGRVGELRRQMEVSGGEERGATFAVLLIDGLSKTEELVTSALYWGLDDIPLIGGSAGDNLHFEKTTLILNGEVRSDAAIIILVRSKVPFVVFKTDNFTPTGKKLVVTEAIPDERRVIEFNAEPAADVYAEAVGVEPGSLGPLSFASHPVVVRVGGEYYCRSIQKLNPDKSLSFFCAIDKGVVLTVAQPKGMVESTREKLRELSDQLGGIDVVLGFDCVLRRLDAQNRQSFRAISTLYKEQKVIGFGTYGEQYRSMHLNQTLTGIAFGTLKHAAE
ncbi:FIST N-terminal domain-containing protein [Mesorhizobium sp. CAU 1732]|uniref:FIST N-terminal domain-containing protein n=1 Tax=Mesorhizobium sp. CAU 1732 TaxID=3140358 RepID=UPI00325FFB4F